ncbi:hypothetical protein [Streptomyces corynorhini]|uniref:Secreted protein n=1 Tax=Streptomyces corynorhini TaxID=2282652 RepID=A0A370BH63_9ACTN|nr:hypothetical protein [Streptomyces corynorhini]RDG38725.1 hypothetical protein DVH02_07645 [Streptomyces corynorhini]
MQAAITIISLLFVVFMALGVYVGVKAIGAAKRGVDRTIDQARRTVEDTTLRAKSFGQLGMGAELAQLRLRLRTSMRATQDELQAAVGEDASLSESIALFRRLSAHGRELDDELRHLERDPDRAMVSQRLAELRERTERITRSADSLRWAARDRARKFAEDDLSALSTEIDLESGALRHWSKEPPQGQSAEPDRSDWSDGPESRRTSGPGRGVPPTAEAGDRALDPPAARRWTTYPWQKPNTRQARPETTN